MFCHVHSIAGRKRFAPGDVRHGFGNICDRDEGPPRQPHARRAAADQPGYIVQHLREQDILPAEDVALADPPTMQRREMAAGHVVHMHEVEPGIDEGRECGPWRLR